MLARERHSSAFRVVELPVKLLDPRVARLLVRKVSGRLLIRFVEPSLLSHPYVEVVDGFPLISTAPFTLKSQGGIITLYSTLFEHVQRGPIELLSAKEAYSFDFSSILVIEDDVKVIRVTAEGGLRETPLYGYRWHVPLGTSSLLLDSRGGLYLANVINEEVVSETVAKCAESIYGTSGLDRSSRFLLCKDRDMRLVAISDGVYGILLEDHAVSEAEGLWHVGLSNNVAYLWHGGRTLVYNVDDKGGVFVAPRGLEPLAHFKNALVALHDRKYLVVMEQSRENPPMRLLSKVNYGRLRDLSADPTSGLITICYDDSLLLLNLATESFTLLRERDLRSAATSEDKLLLLSRDVVKVYEIDVGVERISLRKIVEAPTTLVRCAPLGGGLMVCLDLLGRVIIMNGRSLEKLADANPFTRLRSSNGISYMVEGGGPYGPLISAENVKGEGVGVLRPSAGRTIIRLRGMDLAPVKLMARTPFGYYLLETVEASGSLHITKPPKVSLNGIIAVDSHIFLPLGKELQSLATLGEEGIEPLGRGRVLRIEANEATHNILPTLFAYTYDGSIATGKALNTEASPIIRAQRLVTYDEQHYTLCVDGETLGDLHVELEIEALCEKGLKSVRGGGCISLSQCGELLGILLVAKASESRIAALLRAPSRSLIRPHNGGALTLNLNGLVAAVEVPRLCAEPTRAQALLKEGRPFVLLDVVNRCTNLAAHAAVGNVIEMLKPGERRELEVPLDLSYIVKGNLIIAFADVGGVRLYEIPVTMATWIRLAHRLALKMARILGVRAWQNVFSLPSSA